MGCAASEEDDPLLKKGKPAPAPIKLTKVDKDNEQKMLTPANMDVRTSQDLSEKDNALDAALFDMAEINSSDDEDEVTN